MRMTKRDIRREALWHSSLILQTAIEGMDLPSTQGWPLIDPEQDEAVVDAMAEIVCELDRRGELALGRREGLW